MKADHGTTPIPLPAIVDDPRWIGRFSREVRKSIAALRDRKIIVRGRQGRGGYVPPWQVRSNGDGTVMVGAGEVLSLDHEDVTAEGDPLASWFHLKKFFTYDGDDSITVTGTGVIYGSIPVVNLKSTSGGINLDPGSSPATLIWLTSVVPDITDSLTVDFASALPTSGDVFVFEIAQVSLDGSIAVVDKQVLTHNPTLLGWALTGGSASP